MEDFLIKVIEKTNGWVLVIVVALYFTYQGYRVRQDGRALDQTLGILRDTIQKLLASVDRNVLDLNSKVDRLIERIGR